MTADLFSFIFYRKAQAKVQKNLGKPINESLEPFFGESNIGTRGNSSIHSVHTYHLHYLFSICSFLFFAGAQRCDKGPLDSVSGLSQGGSLLLIFLWLCLGENKTH